ncbi:aromatic ring-hydroxylating dioxygenase subunit alpha [Novosphingobium sp. G106]|uniref:aromatic ring-hydroxylating oxygenase subunit alpha n=1 Tax=Novosphingobium sp. G106 TaxID=2849500 RepID=UPI001C2DA55C|nr:aromatic ring-hydroxylating dioxygenase subunit alpha [Novosphingobium sp. G106]MBV1690558.1 aromatic ring-hydroxylating dioxygenase subunit alpha [Novosphingobium sp. G106]
MNVQQSIPMLPTEEAAKLRGRGPVSSRPYYDPEWWELEKQAIFLRTWLHVGHVCEIPEPGSFIRREIEFANASLLIVRGKDGEVRTFHNVCTHRGTQLTDEAAGKASKFSCRYHMWTFGTDGALLSAPDFERFYVAKEDCALKQVQTQVLAGLIFINFAPQPKESVREFFGPIAAEMEGLPMARAVDFTEWTYEIEANWKLNFDNFQENYHLRFIHPRTGASTIGPENPFGYPTHYGFSGPHRSQTLWKNPDPPEIPPTLLMGYSRGAALAAKDGANFPKTDFKLFPAFHIVGLPPAQQYTHTMMPLGPSRTRGTIRMYWTSEAENASRVFAREFGAMSIRDVLSEDRWAVEAGQRGIARGTIEQVHFQDHEMLLRHLYETVQEKVAEYVAERGAA